MKRKAFLLFFAFTCLSVSLSAQSAFKDAGMQFVGDNVLIIRDVPFGESVSETLKLDIVRPAERPSAPMPGLVYIHGGGWQGGDKESGIQWIIPFAEAGYYCVTINYRLTGEAKFPAQIHDCKAAVRWLRGNAEKFGVDPDNIGVWGMSAGGHLVALLGTSGGMAELEGHPDIFPGVSSRVQAVCDFYGPANLLTFQEQSDKVYGTPESPEVLFLGGTIEEKLDLARLASPATHVSEDDPPFLIMHGDADETVPLAQSREFTATLQKAGVPVELHTYAGAGHSLDNQPVRPVVMAFFERCLR